MKWRAALLLLLLSPASMPGQEHLRCSLRQDGVDLCNVEVVPVSGGSGGYGWLRVDVDNLDRRAHRVEVRYRSLGRSSGDVGAQRRIEVQPGAHARMFLPLVHSVRSAPAVDVYVDGANIGSDYISSAAGGTSFLLVSEQNTTALRSLCENAVGSLGGRSGGKAQTVDVDPAALPPDWPLLSGFDVAAVDGRARLPAEVQETLRRYAAAGGTLLVGYPARLQPGPLQQLLATESRRCGLGRILTLDDFTATREHVARLGRELVGVEERFGPVPAGWYTRMQIPGLGEIPGRMFLLVILLFTVLVGPVNFWWLRRRRNPMLALITVPAVGFGCTAAILLYGLLHDGLGLQGVQRSFTVLDQQQHEASAIVTRTVFAGLSPGPLQVGTGVFVDTPDGEQRSLVFDCDAGSIGGTILPSRQPTALVSAQHGVARARLRFRRTGGGGLDVLTDGTLQPTGAWLLRDFDGDYFSGSGSVVRRITGAAGRQQGKDMQRLLAIDKDQSDLDFGDPYSFRYMSSTAVVGGVDGFLRQQFGDGQLPPGSYLLMTGQAAWIEDFGIEVDWVRSEHFVLGILSREDLLP